MRDHGGNLDAALARYGDGAQAWIDLSTGINPVPYPLPEFPPSCWNTLPTRSDLEALAHAARAAYGTSAPILPVAGAQAAIQMIPRLIGPGTAHVLGPTYNEHAASLTAAGWQVRTVSRIDKLPGADLAVVVNPNNPDGNRIAPRDLMALSERVGLLIVDESFADPHPELSLTGHLQPETSNILVMRSFGKFYGLAGLRLGFVLGGAAHIGALSEMAGPWPVTGPAIVAGIKALRDRDWQHRTTERLASDAARLDGLACQAGWTVLDGTTLFRLYDTPDAGAAQDQLARHAIWTRIFPYSPTWIRLGLPGDESGWTRLEKALA